MPGCIARGGSAAPGDRRRSRGPAGGRPHIQSRNREMAKIEIKSEITGTVWKLRAKPGDRVEAGDTLIIIESMKMEIPVLTEDGGTVTEILVGEKDPVAEGQVVAIIEE
jgi:biotin carboxyl carrier protein